MVSLVGAAFRWAKKIQLIKCTSMHHCQWINNKCGHMKQVKSSPFCLPPPNLAEFVPLSCSLLLCHLLCHIIFVNCLSPCLHIYSIMLAWFTVSPSVSVCLYLSLPATLQTDGFIHVYSIFNASPFPFLSVSPCGLC